MEDRILGLYLLKVLSHQTNFIPSFGTPLKVHDTVGCLRVHVGEVCVCVFMCVYMLGGGGVEFTKC